MTKRSDSDRVFEPPAGSVSLVGMPVQLSSGRVTPMLELPAITIPALLEFAGKTPDGQLVRSVAVPWFTVLDMVRRDPEAIYRIEPRVWEEIIAGAYDAAGFEVTLTPRSGDLGRDVIAIKRGVGSIKIIDQVKAYAPSRVVTADEVRAVAGVLLAETDASKAVVTTTSTFAPRLTEDRLMKSLMPYRLELKPRDVLLPWLEQVRQSKAAP